MRQSAARTEQRSGDPAWAPANDRLDQEMDRFIEWFNQPGREPDLHKPAVAHLGVVTIQPYGDGNGRVARAITDLALAGCDGTPLRFYSMSAEIMRRHDVYRKVLADAQTGSMNVAEWMIWFLECLTTSLSQVG